MIVTIIAALVALVIGGAAGYFIFRYVIKGKYNEMIEAANKEAEVVKEKKLLEVKEKFLNKKAELEKEVQQRNSRIQQNENKLKQREISLNQRQEDLGRRKMEIDQYQQRVDNEKKLLSVKQQELDKMQKQEQAKLEELSGLSAEEAKQRLIESLKDQAKLDAASYVNEIMDDAKLNANQQAKKIVIQTIQRVATETAIENSVSVFHIDNDAVQGALFNAGLQMVFNSGVQDYLKQTIGLDYISVTSSLNEGYESDFKQNDSYYYIKIGKYLFNDFMLTVTTGINNEQNSLGFYYNLKNRLGVSAWYNSEHDKYVGVDWSFNF